MNKEIYNYLDYQAFLKDYYQTRKEETPHFSLRLFGRLIEMDASYLAKVINGKRHLGEQYLHNIADYLKFDDGERAYFETLLLFQKARSDKQKQAHFEKLLALRRVYTTCLEEYQYEFYNKWYYTALRNLLEFFPFYNDDEYSLLGDMLTPNITAGQAEKGIELLVQLNLITLDENGRYVLTNSAITTGDSWQSLAITAFQKETIELSKDALTNHQKEERDISSITMNISNEEFEKIREMIRQFRSSVINYVNDNEVFDRVYQLNTQLIPLSKVYSRCGD